MSQPSWVLWYLSGLSSMHLINQLPHPLVFPNTHSPGSRHGSWTRCNILQVQEQGKMWGFHYTFMEDVE